MAATGIPSPKKIASKGEVNMKVGTEVNIQSLGELHRCGFSLEYPDDHMLFLLHDGLRIAVFNQTTVTPQSIRMECARHLREKHSRQIAVCN